MRNFILSGWFSSFRPSRQASVALLAGPTLGLNLWNSVSSNADGRPVYNLIALGSLISVLPLLIAFVVLGKYCLAA